MANPQDSLPSKSEHPSTYIVQDRANEEELIRLIEQDRLITDRMGGLLLEVENPNLLQRVLDVGCGPGGWLIDLAKTYPDISTLAGVDISNYIVTYAREQAQCAQVSDRVQFQIGDALRMLEYPPDFFDLVNQRLAMSFLRTWEWSKIISEYRRVCKPKGMIRITESALIPETNSPALRQLLELLVQALYHAGHFFTPEGEGVTRHLGDLMRQHGVIQVEVKAYPFIYHSSPAARLAYADVVQRLFHTTVPFMRKWVRLPANYQDLYQQMVEETSRPDFTASNTFTTAWGRNT